MKNSPVVVDGPARVPKGGTGVGRKARACRIARLSATLLVLTAALGGSVATASAQSPAAAPSQAEPTLHEHFLETYAERDAKLGDFVARYRIRITNFTRRDSPDAPSGLDVRYGTVEVRRRGDRIAVATTRTIPNPSTGSSIATEFMTWDFYRGSTLHATMDTSTGQISYKPLHPTGILFVVPPLTTDLGFSVEGRNWQLIGPDALTRSRRERSNPSLSPTLGTATSDVYVGESVLPEGTSVESRVEYAYDLSTGASAGFSTQLRHTTSGGALFQAPHRKLEVTQRRDGWGSVFTMTSYSTMEFIMDAVDKGGAAALDGAMATAAATPKIESRHEYELISILPLPAGVPVDERAIADDVYEVLDDERGMGATGPRRAAKKLIGEGADRRFQPVLRYDEAADAWVPVK